MCAAAPVVLAAASTAVSIGGAVASHNAQSQAASANKKDAQQALEQTIAQVNSRASQEEDSTQQQIFAAQRQAQSAVSMTRAQAGSAGVTGNTVDALVNDVYRDQGNFNALSMKNLGMTLDQLQEEKLGAQATEISRINSVPAPNPFATGLQIASAGINFGNTIVQQTPARGTAPKGTPPANGGKP